MPLELSYTDLLNLIITISASSLRTFSLEQNELKIQLETQDTTVRSHSEAQISAVPTPVILENAKSEAQVDQGWQIKAPLVGTFYRSPEVDVEPYVTEGDSVKKGQPLGIIESMKLLNEIESDVDGIVERILAANGQVVGFNDTLFIIKV